MIIIYTMWLYSNDSDGFAGNDGCHINDNDCYFSCWMNYSDGFYSKGNHPQMAVW